MGNSRTQTCFEEAGCWLLCWALELTVHSALPACALTVGVIVITTRHVCRGNKLNGCIIRGGLQRLIREVQGTTYTLHLVRTWEGGIASAKNTKINLWLMIIYLRQAVSNKLYSKCCRYTNLSHTKFW